MRKSSRSKGSGIIGKGKVTPTQIAFIVDRYLCDNRFSETRALFRTEASSLLSKSPLREALKSLLTLDDMLNDYVCLKEQKLAVDQERARLDQEKIRVQNLLQGMQNVMNSYNASLNVPPPVPPAPIPQQKSYSVSSSGCIQHNTQNVMSVSLLGNKRVEFGSFSTPMTRKSITGKRKGPESSVVAPPVSRKTRTATAQASSKANETNKVPQADGAANKISSQAPSETLALAKNSGTNELITGQGSSVAKCLFNKADSSLPSSSTCPRTPQKRVSPGSHKSTSPHKAVTPTNCTIVTKERFVISPLKKITSYTMERSRMISSSSPVKSNMKISNKREHVKGRLNFDDTDAGMSTEAPSTGDLVSTSPSGSEAEADLFDFNLDLLADNYSFSELLVDFDLVCANQNAPIETASGSSPESGNENLESDQGYPEYASTAVTETIQGKDMSTQEPRVGEGSDLQTID